MPDLQQDAGLHPPGRQRRAAEQAGDQGPSRRTAAPTGGSREIYDGLIRNIETASDADVAYDTAIEHAVGQGFGFWRINTRYTCDDAFDQDIVIERVANPFTVYGDPRSTAADSSDWNVAFVVTTMTARTSSSANIPRRRRSTGTHRLRRLPGLAGRRAT